ncbi:hypothetical protein P691DRAFT_826991 [Macrolepiota fuliginosa MF-IS2]|uniref:MATH domain-containing protein n=1 Tax=Macrolepiota fuliginosa MF-IS2 TaxID=1400762 RepID=A0A9P6C7H0_9AGAR|nr:hypothetical protein P691DRAFT_826991 [Macrolepiota fuliginosa MF-IS2]
MDPQDGDWSESCSITFEWTIRNLKPLFDSSKGDAKSKAVKSPKFGGGRWQILFYANAGTPKEAVGTTEGGGYISLFLACEPTSVERESALRDSGKWVRDGIYKFCFELRNVEKNVLHNLKEASNHTFSSKTANWGWYDFARRDSVYYQSISAKTQDAFVIVCTITSSPSATSLLPPGPSLSIPKQLVDTVGSLLDDPRYSDVEFVILRRNQDPKKARRIWASRKLLQRAEHFDDMLGANFAEGTMDFNPLQTPRATGQALSNTGAQSEAGGYYDEYVDSDDEEDDSFDTDDDDDDDDDEVSSQMDMSEHEFAHISGSQDEESFQLAESVVDDDSQQADQPISASQSNSISIPGPVPVQVADKAMSDQVRQQHTLKPHMTVMIKGVAYNTYRALLYYLYTDNIVFAPLSSSFTSSRLVTFSPPTALASSPGSEATPPLVISKKGTYTDSATSRKEWIREWMKHNPDRPAPCSAKAIYREADRLDLRDLKARAAQHITKSLTIENIAYEVFSPFASTFEEIRKVEVAFFLKHWLDIRTSDAMKSVWQQIRNGRHPGFEEVWPTIAMNLEFKAATSTVTSPSKSEAPQPMIS